MPIVDTKSAPRLVHVKCPRTRGNVFPLLARTACSMTGLLARAHVYKSVPMMTEM